VKKLIQFGCVVLILLRPLNAAAEKITVVTEILPPWQTTDGRDVGGIATEVVEAALRAADIEFSIHAYPWARAYRIALDEPNVLIYSMIRTPEREPLFKWVGVIGSVKEYFFRLAGRKDIQLTGIEAASKYLSIIPRDDYRHQFLAAKGFKVGRSIHLVNRQEQALRMLYAGRGDLVLDDELTLAYELRQFNLSPDKIKTALYIPEMSVDFEMAFNRRTRTPLAQKVRAGLAAIKANGLYRDIMKWHEIPDHVTD